MAGARVGSDEPIPSGLETGEREFSFDAEFSASGFADSSGCVPTQGSPTIEEQDAVVAHSIAVSTTPSKHSEYLSHSTHEEKSGVLEVVDGRKEASEEASAFASRHVLGSRFERVLSTRVVLLHEEVKAVLETVRCLVDLLNREIDAAEAELESDEALKPSWKRCLSALMALLTAVEDYNGNYLNMKDGANQKAAKAVLEKMQTVVRVFAEARPRDQYGAWTSETTKQYETINRQYRFGLLCLGLGLVLCGVAVSCFMPDLAPVIYDALLGPLGGCIAASVGSAMVLGGSVFAIAKTVQGDAILDTESKKARVEDKVRRFELKGQAQFARGVMELKSDQDIAQACRVKPEAVAAVFAPKSEKANVGIPFCTGGGDRISISGQG